MRRVRTVSLVALAVAALIAAIVIVAAPSSAARSTQPNPAAQSTNSYAGAQSTGPLLAAQSTSPRSAAQSTAPRASATSVPRPPIVKKYIRYGVGRKAQTADYCRRHYHQHTAWLKSPKAIVLHHTAGPDWLSAWNTFNGNASYNGEKPGVSAHFIIDKDGTIYQLMPLNLRARHAIGMNWKSIGIEFVQEPRSGKDGHWMDRQILARTKQVNAGLKLVRYLRARFHIVKSDVVGHAMANNSRFFRDYTGAKNAAGDWYAAEVKVFRSRL